MIDAVIYYTCSGNSKFAANAIAKRLSYRLYDIDDISCRRFNNLVVVFPVHCQGVPTAIKKFLKETEADSYTLVATYGKASPGNALFEAAKYAKNKVTAAAYLPAVHTYNEEFPHSETPPEEFYEAIGKRYIKIPRRLKTPFAGVLPSARSRTLIKIEKSHNCTNCNVCGQLCPNNAIECGKTNRNCIRCLKCVKSCPHGALYARKGLILHCYLKKPKCNKIIIYI